MAELRLLYLLIEECSTCRSDVTLLGVRMVHETTQMSPKQIIENLDLLFWFSELIIGVHILPV